MGFRILKKNQIYHLLYQTQVWAWSPRVVWSCYGESGLEKNFEKSREDFSKFFQEYYTNLNTVRDLRNGDSAIYGNFKIIVGNNAELWGGDYRILVSWQEKLEMDINILNRECRKLFYFLDTYGQDMVINTFI